MYPSEITTEELELGFAIKEIKSPDSHFAGQPASIKAVIYQHNESYRIIKILNPNDGIEYKLQKYGQLPDSPEYVAPEWWPVGMLQDSDPEIAISKILRYIEFDYSPFGFELMIPVD